MATQSQTKTTAPQTGAPQSSARILALIGKVQGHYGDSLQAVQDAGIAIMEHALKYGDCSKAPMLVRVLPSYGKNRAGRSALIGWFKLFSPIRITMAARPNKEGTYVDKSMMAKDGQPGYAPFRITTAAEVLWHTDPAGAEPRVSELDTLGKFEDQIRNRLKNAMKAAQDGKRFIPTQKDNVVSFADHVLKAIDAWNKENPGVDPEIDAQAKETTELVETREPRVAASA